MTTTVLTLTWSTSRARDTYGYNIARLDDESTGKRCRCMGGGYDMVGTVFAAWLQDVHQDALQSIAGRAYYRWDGAAGEQTIDRGGLYGMTYYRDESRVSLDGACGLKSIQRIAEAIGLKVSQRVNRRGHVAGFTVETQS